MARTNNLTNFLTDVASAIKTKKGSETSIPAANFDTEILALPSQGTYQTKSVTITSNTTTVITPDQDYDAIDELTITTNVPIASLQTKSYTFTSNQTMSLLPDTGYDGFSSVGVTVNVPATTVINATEGEVEGTTLILNDIQFDKELEYIESTGTQYIKTKISTDIIKNNFRIEAAIKWTDRTNAYAQLMGVNYGQFIGIQSNKFRMGSETINIAPSAQTFDEIIFSGNYNTKVCNYNINGTTGSFTRSAVFKNNPITIFALLIDAPDAVSPIDFKCKCQMKYFKFYQDNDLILDLIPVKASNNVVCMYDRIGRVFFTNDGTGSFIAGPEKS